AEIMGREPEPVTKYQPDTPAAVARALSKCLFKDPELRWQSVADLRDELEWASKSPQPSVGSVAVRADRRQVLPWAVAVVFLTATVALAGMLVLRRRAEDPRTYVTTIVESSELSAVASDRFALSPNGRQLAFISRTAAGDRILSVRTLESGTSQTLPG